MSSGKKGNSGNQLPPGTVNRELGVQEGFLTQQKQAFTTGLGAWQPATDYWKGLVAGGQPARVAVGPYADLMSQETQATRNAIQQNMPRGGERNLAEAQTSIAGANNISRLYAGMQPLAAQNLATLAGLPMGVSTGLAGDVAGMANSIFNFASNQNAQQAQSKSQGAQGIGQMAAMAMMFA